MSNKILELAEKLKSKIYFDYNIGKHTWFRTGGNAKIFALIENNSELEIILNEIKNENFYVLGSGSNLLIRDKGYDGTVIKLGKSFSAIKITEDSLEVGASALDVNLSNFAYKNKIKDFEFFSGIPGSIGGAIKMNAGCFGGETKDNIRSIEIYNSHYEKKTILKKDIEFSYRSSNIKQNEIISKAIFNYNYGDTDLIKQKIKNIKNKRLSTQPIQKLTSGSTFKNPPNLFAAKLIEESGCKGLTYGNAYVSDKHANFLMNNGKANANDIENLGKIIIDKVYGKFNIKLEWEIKIIGE